MKFIVSSTALSGHLQAISRVINTKNALPILDCSGRCPLPYLIVKPP